MEVLGKDKFLAGIFEDCKKADLGKVTFVNEMEAAEQAALEATGRLKAIAEQNKPFDVTEAIIDDVAHVLGLSEWKEHSRDEFKKGMLVEQEHGGTVGYDPVIIGKIVLDHLKEAKDYYTKLATVEAGMKEAKQIKEAAQPEKLTIVAKGIADKAEADKIAADKKGIVSPDEEDKEKFMVVVKESAPDAPITDKEALAYWEDQLKNNKELTPHGIRMAKELIANYKKEASVKEESQKIIKEGKDVNENLQIALSHAVTSLDNASKFANAALKAEGIDKKEQLDLAMQELKSAEADIDKAIDARKLVPTGAAGAIAPVAPVAAESKEIAELAEKLFLVKYLKGQKSISEKARKFIAGVEAVRLSEEKRGKVMEAFQKLCAEKK
jgi:hypothetical protein